MDFICVAGDLNQAAKGILNDTTSGQKAAATRERNYGLKAGRKHVDEMLKELPNVNEEDLMADLSFYEHLVAYRDMVARDAAAKAATYGSLIKRAARKTAA